MLLRESGRKAGKDLEIETVTAGTGDAGVPFGDALVAFADAVIGGDKAAVDGARAQLREALDERSFVDAVAVVAGFNGIVRVADATGIPLDEAWAGATDDFRTRLGIDAYHAAE